MKPAEQLGKLWQGIFGVCVCTKNRSLILGSGILPPFLTWHFHTSHSLAICKKLSPVLWETVITAAIFSFSFSFLKFYPCLLNIKGMRWLRQKKLNFIRILCLAFLHRHTRVSQTDSPHSHDKISVVVSPMRILHERAQTNKRRGCIGVVL